MKNVIKKTVIIALLILSQSNIMNAQNDEIIPVTGVFKEIDVANQNQALSILTGEDKEQRFMMADIFFQDQNKWYPPVIYAVSKVLFEKGYKDDAAMWFYIGQIRARIDANLCKDESARGAVTILNNEFGGSINEYALQDIKKLETTVKDAVEFVSEYEPTYDQRWINLHGMWAINGMPEGKTLSFPKEDWAAIKKKTIADYYAGFEKYVLKK